MDRNALLNRLVVAYRQGELVPFIGSGMSCPVSPGLLDFVAALEREAGLEVDTSKDATQASVLTRRADRAVQRLAYAGELERACRSALKIGTAGAEAPPQTAALANTYWPLVISTNYDDVYVRATQQQKPSVRVLGRSHMDCREVLRSLDLPLRPSLWAVQGYLGRAALGGRSERRLGALARQIVVGHHQYQRVIHEDRLFRRAFAEVFRRRSFLFLGSGLSEDYFVNLFGEILHGFGAGTRPHFALMSKSNAADPDFLLTRLNVNLLTYDSHDELPQILTELSDRLRWSRLGKGQTKGPMMARGAPRAWTYEFGEQRHASVTLEAGPLPALTGLEDGVCAAASLGRSGPDKLHSGQTEDAIFEGVAERPKAVQLTGRDFVYRFGGTAAFGAAPTSESRRDLRAIGQATTELLEVAEEAKFSTVHVPLLAAGQDSSWPRVFSLLQMLRGIAAYGRSSTCPVSVVVHIVDPSVVYGLCAHQVHVQEILACDDLRFWIEVDGVDGSAAERILALKSPNATVGEMARLVGVPVQNWRVGTLPSPDAETPRREQLLPLDEVENHTLEDFGVFPGSTLCFRCLERRT